MKKVVIVVSLMFALLAGLFVTLPVMAEPSEAQKVSVKVEFTITSSTIVERWLTGGNISHRLLNQVWSVYLTIGDSSVPIEGTATVVRRTDYRYTKPGGVDQILTDDYVFSLPTEAGGFQGHSHGMLTDWNAGPPSSYNIDVHVMLHGTGAFEGQTLNAWQEGLGTTPLWEGYLLKP